VEFNHQYINVEGINIHIIEAGVKSNPTFFFIHGWPTCWIEFKNIMEILSTEYHVIAIDLPGIGGSKTPLKIYTKYNIAKYIYSIINIMNLSNITLVGCDIGGQVVYAFIKNYSETISNAVIMNVAIPGIEPWEEVKRNPYIWHFAFHAIQYLPETLVAGNELAYFDYFYTGLVVKGNKISNDNRKLYASAYNNLEALNAGFNLYRCFPVDEKNNIELKNKNVSIPVLYVRGSDERINLDSYIHG
jgi:pimeloyl-ACP methyl ester carboxylesterase